MKKQFMSRAIELSIESVQKGGGRFGSVFVKDNKIFSNGGRVFNALSVSDKLLNARKKALNLIKKIGWKKGFYRNDIGWRAIKNK